MIAAERDTFAKETFQSNMRHCFEAVGLCMNEKTGEFVEYKSHKRGTISHFHSLLEQAGAAENKSGGTFIVGEVMEDCSMTRAPADCVLEDRPEPAAGDESDSEPEPEAENETARVTPGPRGTDSDGE